MNCRNCGGPNPGARCDYCGTRYAVEKRKAGSILRITQTERPWTFDDGLREAYSREWAERNLRSLWRELNES